MARWTLISCSCDRLLWQYKWTRMLPLSDEEKWIAILLLFVTFVYMSVWIIILDVVHKKTKILHYHSENLKIIIIWRALSLHPSPSHVKLTNTLCLPLSKFSAFYKKTFFSRKLWKCENNMWYLLCPSRSYNRVVALKDYGRKFQSQTFQV